MTNAPATMATCGRSHAPRSRGKLMERPVPNPRLAAIPLAPFPLVLLLTIFSTLCRWPLACPLSSLCPPSSVLAPLLATTHLAYLPPCCGSQSWSPSVFASMSVPCPGEPALSSAVVGHTAQANRSPPPSFLSSSGHLHTYVAVGVKPMGSSAHRRCSALASRMHHPCIATSHSHLLSSSSVCPAFTSLAPMPPPILIYTPVLPSLVPLPKHWNHPMAHVAGRRHWPWSQHHTLARLPPAPPCARSGGRCRCGGPHNVPPLEPDNGGLKKATLDPRHTP